jgi:23S rRNA (adenine1618-N6)-methyltransferase
MQKKPSKQNKQSLHSRNKHKGRYNLQELVEILPGLKEKIVLNPRGEETINFSDPEAVLLLNKALLQKYYSIVDWDIPVGYLCPPIPGRADYIHNVADLLSASNFGKIPQGKNIRAFDVGVGANCIYP